MNGENAPVTSPKNPTGIRTATGRDRPAWFALLDEWGAADRPYRQIADWLTGEHDLSRWWAQKIIVEYQQERGIRPPGIRPDGTFTVTASKTIGATVEQVEKAFVDADVRESWLPAVDARERTSRPRRSVRFDWGAGGSRVNVQFVSVEASKTQVSVEHERLPRGEAADEAKAFWRERLSVLKDLLDG